MKLDELKELKIDGIRSVSLDKRFCFNEFTKIMKFAKLTSLYLESLILI